MKNRSANAQRQEAQTDLGVLLVASLSAVRFENEENVDARVWICKAGRRHGLSEPSSPKAMQAVSLELASLTPVLLLVMDIASWNFTRCGCVYHSIGRYLKGVGSYFGPMYGSFHLEPSVMPKDGARESIAVNGTVFYL